MNKNGTVFVVVLLAIVAIALMVTVLTRVKEPAEPVLQNPEDVPQDSEEPEESGAAEQPDEDWLTYNDEKNSFSFRYPSSFGANVWSPIQWPPTAVSIAAGKDPLSAGCPQITEEDKKSPFSGTTVSDIPYTLYVGSDAGAGQLYSDYCYVFDNGSGNVAVLDFTIKSHTACGSGECGAYCGTQYEVECANLDRKAAIEDPIKKIAETFAFTSVVTSNSGGAGKTPIMACSVKTNLAVEKTITLADDQTNVVLGVGERFLVNLGTGYEWNAWVVNQSIASPVKGAAVIQGTQGIYEVINIGDTDLTAIGGLACGLAPSCPRTSREFTVHLIVR